MSHNILKEIEKRGLKQAPDVFNIGDTVDVHVRIVEGDKERIQIFSGVVIGRRGSGVNESFTVRRLVQGQGVERIFPVHSPRVEKVEVKRMGKVRRAKLNYLRDRVGKATKIAERRHARPSKAAAAAEAAAPQQEPAVETPAAEGATE